MDLESVKIESRVLLLQTQLLTAGGSNTHTITRRLQLFLIATATSELETFAIH